MSNQLAALMVIDMQRGMSDPAIGERNNPDAENNVQSLLIEWRKAGWPVVHVRHISRTPSSPFWPGQPGAEFQPALVPQPKEHVVEKNIPCAFTNSGLERWLHAREIKRLIITGVSTSNSVEATARTAGNLGFDTYLVADATFTFAKQDYAGTQRSAEEVHAMSLANLKGEYATICITEEVLASIKE
ncbi:nicotinamidase-related amidase [Vreelandella songnenensis]|uniref:Nicotinamidase-related amidase n=1 Tax=Vreelandella songnenensis TaxID=1176243 RepID=A0A2T0UUK5_9GAMM|nr:cysteine hydrolase family protein [Halomonas songnenensis]PRY61619.1 nicotinamidase-related amidase [Halomonas songnenensis]